jgi:hypothetical protein
MNRFISRDCVDPYNGEVTFKTGFFCVIFRETSGGHLERTTDFGEIYSKASALKWLASVTADESDCGLDDWNGCPITLVYAVVEGEYDPEFHTVEDYRRVQSRTFTISKKLEVKEIA